MKVKEAMHEGVTWVSPDMPLAQVAAKMRAEDIGAIPVGENDRLIGMVTDRDICCRGLANGHDISKLKARDVMSKPILYCNEDETVETALKAMKKGQVRRLPVINAKKRMVGILSLGDLSAKASANLSGEALKSLSAHHSAHHHGRPH